jgi:hypothetical protein
LFAVFNDRALRYFLVPLCLLYLRSHFSTP